jgi:hypothetical protein
VCVFEEREREGECRRREGMEIDQTETLQQTRDFFHTVLNTHTQREGEERERDKRGRERCVRKSQRGKREKDTG